MASGKSSAAMQQQVASRMSLSDMYTVWYNARNVFAQTLIQLCFSIFTLFFITALGGLVFSGFESDQARARRSAHGAAAGAHRAP
jgi:hypothetical protein